MLGPRARIEKIAAELGMQGDPRLFGPIGVDIGADGPEQVGLSIVAELLAVHAHRKPRASSRTGGADPCLRPRLHPKTAAVVLAAGSSTRMGENKMLLPLGGETVVRRAVRTAVEAALDPIIVVLGHEPERVRAALAGLPCRTVVNPIT